MLRDGQASSMGWRWWCLAAATAFAASLCNYALQLRPAFPVSTLALEPELLELLRTHPRVNLSDQQWYQFNATGVLVVRGAIPAAVLERLRDLLDDDPPAASPLFGQSLTYVTSHAWAHYEALRQFTASSLSASLAAQLLNAPRSGYSTVRLVNTVAYGIGRGQTGADWHTDAISYRPIRRQGVAHSSQASTDRAPGSTLRDDRGVSVWIPLQRLDAVGNTGGGLSVVPLNTASLHCYDEHNLDAVNGRLRVRTAANFKGVAACERTLTQRGVSVGAMELGDLVLFSRAVWHRTEPPQEGFPYPTRWTYTERFVPEGSVYSKAAEEHWLDEYIMQPLCQARLRDGDVLGGDCFPSLPPPSLQALGIGATGAAASAAQQLPFSELLPRPSYSGTTVLERLAGVARHQIVQATQHRRHLPVPEAAGRQVGRTEAMLRAWGLAFFWTQLSECPVYLVLQPLLMRCWPESQPRTNSLCAGCCKQLSLFDLGVGFGASLITHPPATACFWKLNSWRGTSLPQEHAQDKSSIAAGPYDATQFQLLLSQYSFEVVEVGVFLVEMLWLCWAHADVAGGQLLRQCGPYSLLIRAACCSLCANLTSIMLGVAINAWAPHLLGSY